MSRARHKDKMRANGGPVKADWNAGEEQNAAKEAMERKKGGKVEHMEAEGDKAKKRGDRRGRARGGRIGANLMPLSTAAKVKHVTPGETPEEGDDMVK